MESTLMKKVVDLMPKIKDKQARFDEVELLTVKAAFESITGIKVGSMMSCGGMLCEDFRRSIVNYMASYKHVTTETPKKTTPPTDPETTDNTVEPEAPSERDQLMAKALEIAEEKEIKKPHHRAGKSTLIKYIEKNG
jgi:hypothetical protein